MRPIEIVVISGKGGTGKTTVTSSLIPYLDNVVIADCDVDAPDLNILINGEKNIKEDFYGIDKAKIDKNICIECGKCQQICKFDAIDSMINLNDMKCEGCSVCTLVCPVSAINMVKSKTGELYYGNSKFGKVYQAQLLPGEEASGKLVAELRKRAKRYAREEKKDIILIDGSPGIACNVISSIIGTNVALIVVEPTISGIHDLKRLYELISNYPIECFVIINKYDISMERTREIEEYCKNQEIKIGLKIPFEKKIVESILNKEIPSIRERDFFENIGFFKFIDKLKDIIY